MKIKILITGLALLISIASVGQPADYKIINIDDLDYKSTNVQFRNIAAGEFVVLKSDPRGGGALEAGSNRDPEGWYLYQAGNAEKNNFEVKRNGIAAFNWSNYDQRTDEGSFIAWNHAKRQPSNISPAAPHDWYLEQVAPGEFRIKYRNGEYLELIPSMVLHLKNSTAPKIITRKLDAVNRYQVWQIYTNTKKFSNTITGKIEKGSKYFSPNKAYYMIFQGDGNLCVYKSQDDSFIWGSYNNAGAPLGNEEAKMAQGNLKVFKNNSEVWSTGLQGEPNAKLKLCNSGKLKIIAEDQTELWSS